MENAPKWLEKQQLQFPRAISLTPTPSLEKVIFEEMQANTCAEDVLRQRGELKLKKIADITKVEYISDRLEPERIYII